MMDRKILKYLAPSMRADSTSEAPWTTDRLKAAWDAYKADHAHLRFDPEARNLRHTHVTTSEDGREWVVQQVLVDPALSNDWMAECVVDLARSRLEDRPIVQLVSLGPIG